MMVMVFLFIVPASVMLARFYSKRPGFAIVYHAQLHIFAFVLLFAAFILPFFAVGPKRNLSNPHHGIGVAVFVMFILQIVGGRLVRHITKLRSLRIMIHQWSGRIIAILGIIQVPLGLTLYGSPKYLFILYAVWMAILVAIYFVLSYRSEGRREMYMSGNRSEAGKSRMTESEYYSDHKSHHGGGAKWLGPLAAGAGLFAMMRGRKKDQEGEGSRARSRSRSRSASRSRAPEVIPSRRGSASYLNEKYSEVAPQKGGGGGFMKILGGAAAGIGAGKLFSSFMKRGNERREDEYSAVSTDTPRRNRTGRGAGARSDMTSEVSEDYRRDGTYLSSMPPTAMTQTMTDTDLRNPPRPSHTRGNPARRGYDDETEYSSYVSPSRRPQEDNPSGGLAKGIFAGLGMGWISKKLADRKAKKEEQRLRDEEDMRSGTQLSRFTGDGHPSPSRRDSRPPPRRGARTEATMSEFTESSFDSRPAESSLPARARAHSDLSSIPPVPPIQPVPVPSNHSRSRSRSKRGPESVSMPPIAGSSRGNLQSDGDSYLSSVVSPPKRRESSRRRQAGERAAMAAAARASSLAAEENVHIGSPKSVSVSVKVDEDRGITLRRLTEEEQMAEKSRTGSDSSVSTIQSPSNGRRRYRRDSSQRRAEAEAEQTAEEERFAPLSPPHPSFAGGRKPKDSAYYSGQPAQLAPPGSVQNQPDQTVSSLGTHGTWSAMSLSPSGQDKGNESAAADNRRRRRQERRRGSSSRPSGTDMYD